MSARVEQCRVEQCRVELRSGTSASRTDSRHSGCSDGSRVTVENQPGGEFRVSALPGAGSRYLQGASSVRLVPGRTTTVTMRLTQGGTVAIRTTARATGAAIRGTCFILKRLGDGYLGDDHSGCGNAAGRSTTPPVAAGTYELFAIAPSGYGHQWVGESGGTGDQRAAARIVVKPGRTVQAPRVLLDPPGTVTGVVSDASGAPLPGADVAYSAWGAQDGPNWNTTTDREGRYTVDRLGPYGWPLLFHSEGHPREWSGHRGNRFLADRVPITAGAITSYDFSMARATATLTGRVAVPASPGATWRIHAYNAFTGDEMAAVDGTGRYSLPLIGPQLAEISWSYDADDVPWTEGRLDPAVKIPT
ncbi:carboxypeptidase-like regulatory domain-containing protein [Actinoplanes sp. NPDC051851]|uniref:MSCRAMM family protein n=1 Tax=Actinoplanes sp. NPDC051851 TaxID=3154753 RepID=UPI003427017A